MSIDSSIKYELLEEIECVIQDHVTLEPVVATFAYLTHSERDGVADAGEILEGLFEVVVVPCRSKSAAMTNDDSPDVTGERWMFSDLEQSLQSFGRYIIGAVLEESHREAISRDDVEDTGREPKVRDVIVRNIAGDLAQDFVREMRNMRVGHDRSV